MERYLMKALGETDAEFKARVIAEYGVPTPNPDILDEADFRKKVKADKPTKARRFYEGEWKGETKQEDVDNGQA